LARGVDVHIDMAALSIAVVLSGLTSVLASLVPALRLSGTDPNRALRAGGSAGTSRGQQRIRSGFVVTQVALSLVLLVVSGILLRNLSGLLSTKLGFAPEKILTVPIALAPANYANRDPLATLYTPLIERVRHLPGVEAAGIVNLTPIESWGFNGDVHISGQPPYPPKMEATAEMRYVSQGYFDAMGIQLRGGRTLSPALDPWQNPAGTVVVNEAFRRKFLTNGGDPVGAHIDDNDKAELKTGIVGMTTDIRQNLREQPLAEMDYLVDQIPPKDRLSVLNNMTLMVRTTGDPQQLVAPIREALHQIDATVPFQTPMTMSQIISESLVFERMENWLFGIFAGLALTLALVGIYGLISHEVELRTRDIGIRMALGSTRQRVMAQVLLRVAILMTTGIAVGGVLTLALRNVLASVIEMRVAKYPWLLVGLALAMALFGVCASLLPARRAASIDPMQALRSE
jgi:predicted permease